MQGAPIPSLLLLATQLEIILSSSDWPSTCFPETALDLSHVHLASSSHLEAYSVQQCALHCLQVRPETRFAMVSYRPAPFLGLLGDKFNCICGMVGAVKENEKEVPGCTQTCPVGGLLCGAPGQVSTYCLGLGCTGEPKLCEVEKPHSAQGCISEKEIAFQQVAHVRGIISSRSDCVWKCREHSGDGLALTRRTEGRLTCSCAPRSALHQARMIRPEVCELLNDTMYDVSCESDLHAGDITSPSQAPTISTASPSFVPQLTTSQPVRAHRCGKPYQGCIYRDLFSAGSGLELTLADPKPPQHLHCQAACSSLSPLHLSVGVLWNSSSKSLH